jgi:hypothetical protein
MTAGPGTTRCPAGTPDTRASARSPDGGVPPGGQLFGARGLQAAATQRAKENDMAQEEPPTAPVPLLPAHQRRHCAQGRPARQHAPPP